MELRRDCGYPVGKGSIDSPVYGGGCWPVCRRGAIGNCVRELLTTTHSLRHMDLGECHLGLVEGATTSPTRMVWTVQGNNERGRPWSSRTWRHRNPQVVPASCLVGVGLR